jgi:predicted nuclease of predicted toxin-antitoxin system
LKRRSEPSSEPPELVFFLDRSLGKRKVADALREAGVDVEVHDDHFPPDAKDEEWLAAVGARGWAVLTKDDRIRYREHEREALLSANVRAFVLTNRNLSGNEMAQIFVAALSRMKTLLTTKDSAFIATVTRSSIRVIVER